VLATPFSERVARVAPGLVFLLPLVQHAEVDLRADRRGLAFAEDLLLLPEDGSLMLVTGDAMNGAAAYVCGVQERCGGRIVFSPGQLHMSWFSERLRREYPELELPEFESGFLTTRDVVAATLERRTVYIAAMLLEREPPLRELFQYLPEWLLLRVIPHDALEPQKSHFVKRARRFAAGDGCAGCGMAHTDLLRPSLELHMTRVYGVALINHARVLRAFFDEHGLAKELEERAHRTDPEAVRAYL
jgi:hypothetical protein